jgi:hypothetical protein
VYIVNTRIDTRRPLRGSVEQVQRGGIVLDEPADQVDGRTQASGR